MTPERPGQNTDAGGRTEEAGKGRAAEEGPAGRGGGVGEGRRHLGTGRSPCRGLPVTGHEVATVRLSASAARGRGDVAVQVPGPLRHVEPRNPEPPDPDALGCSLEPTVLPGDEGAHALAPSEGRGPWRPRVGAPCPAAFS